MAKKSIKNRNSIQLSDLSISLIKVYETYKRYSIETRVKSKSNQIQVLYISGDVKLFNRLTTESYNGKVWQSKEPSVPLIGYILAINANKDIRFDQYRKAQL